MIVIVLKKTVDQFQFADHQYFDRSGWDDIRVSEDKEYNIDLVTNRDIPEIFIDNAMLNDDNDTDSNSE